VSEYPKALLIPSTKCSSRKGHPVTGVVQHYTGAGSGAALARWLAGPSARVSTHIIICRDGTVIQQVPFEKAAWHAGTSRKRNDFWKGEKANVNVNLFTIGIENSNRGWLMKDADGNFFTARKKNGVWVQGSPYLGPAPEKAANPKIGEYRYWEPYTDKLVKANIDVLKFICESYPDLMREDFQGHSQISPDRKKDPGPLFPGKYILDEVFGHDSVDDKPELSGFTAGGSVSDDGELLEARRDQYDEEAEMCLAETEEP